MSAAVQLHPSVTPWHGVTPRAWQADALPVALEAMRAGRRALVQAVMGAGKSIFLSEVARLVVACDLGADEVLVVSTPTQDLTRQLYATLSARLGARLCGQYFADRKQLARVVVVCHASMPAALEAITADGRTVGAWIADEAHKTQADEIRAWSEAATPRLRLGVSATPWRGRRDEPLTLWDEIVYRYGVAEALRDRVIVPWRVERYLGSVAESGEDAATLEMLAGAEGPGVVSAYSIEDAEAFAERLRGCWGLAEAIHSRHSLAERASLLERLRTGELRALVHVCLLSEGVDLPWLRWLALRRRVGSRTRFPQEVGRALRSAPGKDYATIYDPHGLFDTMEISIEDVLLGVEPEETGTGDARDEEIEGFDLFKMKREKKKNAKRALSSGDAWLLNLSATLRVLGVIKPPPLRPAAYTRERAEPHQIEALRRALPRVLQGDWPPGVRASLKGALLDGPHSKAAVADLCAAISALTRTPWPQPATTMVATQETP